MRPRIRPCFRPGFAALLAAAMGAAACSSAGGGAGGTGGAASETGGASGVGGGAPGSGGATGGASAGTGGAAIGTGGGAGGVAGAVAGRGGAAGGGAGGHAGGAGGHAGGAAGGKGGAAGGGGGMSGGAGGAGSHVCATGAENDDVSIACPAGQVIVSVVFASFGTPTGTCGGFAAGSCDATDSVELVRNICVGHSSCVIPARNDTFGDPCDKTTKKFAAEVACGTGGAANGCPFSGHVTYTLMKSANPSAAEQAAYPLITAAMDAAVANYNCYANITKADTVTYNTSVQTADGNVNGSIRFGPDTTYMTMPTAMHEIGHTVGIGSSPFDALVSNGIFTGTNATNQLREITGNATDQVHGDTQHFWPYGLNYDSEYHDLSDAINHCKMVTAIRKDMGMN